MTVFWNVASCCLVQVADVSEVLAAFITHRPDYGGSKHLRNVGKVLPYYTV
jgi:hypothetical protein